MWLPEVMTAAADSDNDRKNKRKVEKRERDKNGCVRKEGGVENGVQLIY